MGAAGQDLDWVGGVGAAVPGEQSADGVAGCGFKFFAQDAASDFESVGGIAERGEERLGGDGHFYFLEANPNPEIAEREEFASAAKAGGVAYPELLQRIINLGLRQQRVE